MANKGGQYQQQTQGDRPLNSLNSFFHLFIHFGILITTGEKQRLLVFPYQGELEDDDWKGA